MIDRNNKTRIEIGSNLRDVVEIFLIATFNPISLMMILAIVIWICMTIIIKI